MIQNNCGVYKITCTKNDRFYIGQSRNISNRFHEHLRSLRCNRHFNFHMQRCYNKYGEESFVFEILKYCNESEVIQIEYELLQEYKNDILSMNICTEARASRQGCKNSDSHRKKCSRAKLGIPSSNKGIPMTLDQKLSRSKLTAEDDDIVRCLYNTGVQIKALCEKFKVSYTSIRNSLNRTGGYNLRLSRSKSGKVSKIKSEDSVIKELFLQGYSPLELAERYNVVSKTIVNSLKRSGVYTPPKYD